MTSKVQIITDADAAKTIQQNKIVLIDCWAPWCGPCKQIAPIIDKLADQYEGSATIAKLNIDENPDFPSLHHIRSIPTLLIFKDGEKVEQLIGLQPMQVISDKLDRLINQ
ncbi:MAG: thioredoxin [Bacteroidota bacterium]